MSWSFDKKGVIIINNEDEELDEDTVMMDALEAGAEDVASDENGHEVTTSVENFAIVRDALEAKLGGAESARLTWKPLNTVAPSEDAAASLIKLLDVLEDNDDVQTVEGNFDISEELMQKLTA